MAAKQISGRAQVCFRRKGCDTVTLRNIIASSGNYVTGFRHRADARQTAKSKFTFLCTYTYWTLAPFSTKLYRAPLTPIENKQDIKGEYVIYHGYFGKEKGIRAHEGKAKTLKLHIPISINN